jgi:hypothetical protein
VGYPQLNLLRRRWQLSPSKGYFSLLRCASQADFTLRSDPSAAPYVSATNLLTLTDYSGMDPEVNQYGNSGSVQGIDWGTYPLNKSVVLGVKVEF